MRKLYQIIAEKNTNRIYVDKVGNGRIMIFLAVISILIVGGYIIYVHMKLYSHILILMYVYIIDQCRLIYIKHINTNIIDGVTVQLRHPFFFSLTLPGYARINSVAFLLFLFCLFGRND